MKRTISIILTILMLPLGMFAASFTVSAESLIDGYFTDLPDEETRQAADLLYRLGIVGGDGDGRFNPDGGFDRATMAVIATRLSGIFEVEAFGDMVLFPDVRASHWAHKWINAASSLGIVTGELDGLFHPGNPMLFGHMVTVLVKLLGYDDTDVGFNWPLNYINKANSLGISGGMSFPASHPLTRGEAAKLIYNFLLTERKGGRTYIESSFGVTLESTVYGGKLAMLIYDKYGELISAVADEGVTYRDAVISEAQQSRLMLADGSVVPITSNISVWEWDGAVGGYLPASFKKNEPVTLIFRRSTLIHIVRGNRDDVPDTVETILFFDTAGEVSVVSAGGKNYVFNGVLSDSLRGKLATLLIDKDGMVCSIEADRGAVYTKAEIAEAQSRIITLSDGTIVPITSTVGVWDWDGAMKSYAPSSFAEGEAVTLIYRDNVLIHILREDGDSPADPSVANTILFFDTVGGVSVVSANGKNYIYDGILDEYYRGMLASLKIDEKNGVITSIALDTTVSYRKAEVAEAHPRLLMLSDGTVVPVASAVNVWAWDGGAVSYIPNSFAQDEPVTLIYRGNTLVHILRGEDANTGSPSDADTILFFDRVGSVSVITINGKNYIYNQPLEDYYRGMLAALKIDEKNNTVTSISIDNTVTYKKAVITEAQSRLIMLSDGTVAPVTSSVGVWSEDGTKGSYSPASVRKNESVTLIYRGNTLLHILNQDDRGTIETVMFYEVYEDFTIITANGRDYIYHGVLHGYEGRLAVLGVDDSGVVNSIDIDQTVTYKQAAVSGAFARVLILDDDLIIPLPSELSVWERDGTVSDYKMGTFEKYEPITLVYRGEQLIHIIRDIYSHSSEPDSIETVLFFYISGGMSIIPVNGYNYVFPSVLDNSMRGMYVSLVIDDNGYVQSIIFDPDVTYEQVTIAEAKASLIILADGTALPVTSALRIWDNDGVRKSYDPDDLAAGDQVKLIYRGNVLIHVIKQ